MINHSRKKHANEEEVMEKIIQLLSKNRQGLTISDISQNLDINRTLVLNILNLLVGSGEISMKTFGRAKVYTLTSRIPIARVMSLSSDLFLFLDEQLYIEDCNDPFASFFKTSLNEIKGQNIQYSKIPSFFSMDIIKTLQDAAMGTSRIFEGYVGEIGSENYFHISCIPLQEQDLSIKVALVLHDITIHKKYEEQLENNLQVKTDELHVSDSRYQTLTELAPVGIFETNAEGKVVYVNKKWCELSGLSVKEALGTGWENAMHPEDREFVKNLWYKHVSEGISFNTTFRFHRKDGSSIHILTLSNPIRNKNGVITGYLGTDIDLTDRIEAEEMIQHLNTRLSSILDSVNDGIFTLDRNRTVLSCNKTGCNIFQFEEKEIIGKNIRELYCSEENGNIIDQTIRKKLQKEGKCRGITKVRRGDDEERILEITISPLSCIDDFSGYIAIFRDITEHYQEEMKILKQDDEFRSILEGFIDAVGVMDKNGTILYANPGAIFYLTGKYDDELIGRNISEFVLKNLKKSLIPDIKHVIQNQEVVLRKLCITVRGEESIFMIRLIPIEFGPEKIPAVLSRALDITQVDKQISPDQNESSFSYHDF